MTRPAPFFSNSHVIRSGLLRAVDANRFASPLAGTSPDERHANYAASTADAFSLSDRGRIVVGRRADLVMVRGNPIDDVIATRDIVRVWRAGVALRQ
jgi:hypothetical protein